MVMFTHARPAIVMMVLMTALLGLAYPFAITGVSEAALPFQANGSLVRQGNSVVGSELIGQTFTRPEYLHARPSAAGSNGYDASASSGSNLGPLSPDLAKRVAESAATLRSEAPGQAIPADAVTTSGSGLDPHISPAFARLQALRIARARGLSEAEVMAIINQHVEPQTFGFLGQPRVNVLMTNLALDRRAHPRPVGGQAPS